MPGLLIISQRLIGENKISLTVKQKFLQYCLVYTSTHTSYHPRGKRKTNFPFFGYKRTDDCPEDFAIYNLALLKQCGKEEPMRGT